MASKKFDHQIQRTKEMQDFVDAQALKNWGMTLTDAIRKSLCVMCHKEAKTFTDDKSVKEYNMSGMCQICQDAFFGVET